MESNYMHPDSVIEVEFITDESAKIHYHGNIELFYLLEGNVRFQVENRTFDLSSGDIVVVNANQQHSYHSTGTILGARFQISYYKFCSLLGLESVLLWCNSAEDPNPAFKSLRSLIFQILAKQVSDSPDMLTLLSLYYQLLDLLRTNFLLSDRNIRLKMEKSAPEDERINELFQYIRLNYNRKISLQSAADALYLSPTYLSKYVRRRIGISFTELINSVRLGHAIQDLMYTDSSILKIALDSGFPNVASFNKVFREHYQMTPSDFRKDKKNDSPERREHKEQSKEKIKKQMAVYIKDQQEQNRIRLSEDKTTILLDLKEDRPKDATRTNCFSDLINIGRAADLTSTSFQSAVLSLKKNDGARYVRFWDIYSSALFIDIHAPKDQMNFSRLNEVLDFLVDHDLKPYIELGFKPFRILKTSGSAVKETRPAFFFDSEEEARSFYTLLARHLASRYHADEVASWFFEYWKPDPVQVGQDFFSYTPLSEEENERYFRQFDIIASAFRSALPGVKIGGGGFSVQHYGYEGLKNLFQAWKAHDQIPDFISLNLYPYKLHYEKNAFYESRRTDADFMLHDLSLAKKALAVTDFPAKRIHVSEYGFSLSNRNVFNDSCAKASLMLSTMFKCLDQADLFGHWTATDEYAAGMDTSQVLFGGSGLLTKVKIPKPSAYAIEFMHRMPDKIYGRSEDYLIGASSPEDFTLLCCNTKQMNASYFLKDEDKIDAEDIRLMMENTDPKHFHVQIKNVLNGTWEIKSNIINSLYGSVQDECLRLNISSHISRRDMEYLDAACKPRLDVSLCDVKDQVLDFTIPLLPQEIRIVRIWKKN